MKDIKEFQKLFKVNIPVTEHAQYYIDTLAKNSFYAGLPKLVKEYEQYERDCEELGYKNSKAYKLDYALPKMKNYLLNTEAYKNLMEWSLPDKLRTKDEIRNHDGKMLMSIDFKSANYNALKTFDSFDALGDSWEGLCRDIDIHPTLSKSKSFRQYVFGNTNPKRLQRRQHSNIIKIVDSLIKDYGFAERDFVFISHDEIILQCTELFHTINTAIGKIIQRESINMPTHYKVFTNNKFAVSGMNIQSIYQLNGTEWNLKHKTLFKVPGNKFFKYFKRHILKEPIDRRDLMFMSDGEVAIWSENSDAVVERIAPEGEMSMDEIMQDYSYLVKRFRKEVPGVNDSQIRKMINIFMSTCSHCYEQETPCHCWNDE